MFSRCLRTVVGAVHGQAAVGDPSGERRRAGLDPLLEREWEVALRRNAEVLADESAGGGCREVDASIGCEDDEALRVQLGGLVEGGECCSQPPPRLRRAPEPAEVGPEKIKHEPVALGEVAPRLPVEEERLRMPRRGGDRHVQLVLDAGRPEPQGVDSAEPKLLQAQEVGQLERPGVASVVPAADGMLRSDVPVRDADTGVVALVAEPSDQVAASLPYPILLTVVDPVRADELAELDEGLGRERIVRTKVLGLADETKQQLSIPSGDRDHGSSEKYDR